jgi:hypothetical protein
MPFIYEAKKLGKLLTPQVCQDGAPASVTYTPIESKNKQGLLLLASSLVITGFLKLLL